MELSKEAKKSLETVLSKSCDAMASAIDASGKLIKDNTKELALEIITFKGIVENAIGFVMCLSVFLVLLKVDFYLMSCINPEKTVNDGYYIGIGLCMVVQLGVVIGAACSLTEMAKAKFAPRIFLLEYAASLLKPREETKK